MELKIGDLAPSFKSQDQNGKVFDFSHYLGKTAIVLYFYPKNFTPGCDAQACSFRDNHSQFEEAGAKVIGISSDSIASHKKFSEKFNLPFTVLSDTKGIVRKMYGIKADLLGLIPGRETIIINKEGIIVFRYNNNFQATKHIDKALKVLIK